MKIFQTLLVFVFIPVIILTIFFPIVANAGGVVDAVSSAFNALVGAVNTITNTVVGNIEKYVGQTLGISFLADDGNCRLENVNKNSIAIYAGKCGSGGAAGTGVNGSAGAVLVSAGNVCAFQIPITFYNPQMNFSEGGPTQVGYWYTSDNCRWNRRADDYVCDPAFAAISDSNRYGDASCSTLDINGMYGIVNGKCQQLDVSVANCSTSPASPDGTIDETTRKVAIYRFTLPASASQSELDQWFGHTVPDNAGNGFELYEQWEGHWPVGLYHGGNLDSPQPIAIVNYSDMCSGNVCNLTDSTAPNNSYVAYVAKILGPYSMSSDHGHSCDTTGWNKYANTNNTNFATFPEWNGSDPDMPDYQTWITSLGNIISGPYKTETAICEPPDYILSVSKSGSGSGLIGGNLSGINNCDGACSAKVKSGTAVTLSASPSAGSEFAGWSGACSGTGACSISIDGDKNVTAEFNRIKPTLSFSSWSTFELPQQVSLYWSSTNADSCVASGDWSGSKAVNGEEKISKPRGNYSFTLTCSNPGGSASDTKSVSVVEVPQCSFSSSPDSVIPPQPSTLSWNCSGASGGCSIDNGIGSKPVSGSVRVNPMDTTTYNLTCSGADGNRTFSSTVGVGFIQKIKEIIPK